MNVGVYAGLVRPRARPMARRALPREQTGQTAGASVTATFTLSSSAQAASAPPPTSQAATSSGVNNTLNGQTAAGATIDIAGYLRQFCAQGTGCNAMAQQAANAFDKLGPTAAQAAQLMGSGNTPSAVGVAAPIIAGALGGAIGGPAGAAVAAAVVTGAEGFFASLFGSPQPRVTVTCDYKLMSPDGSTGVCFTNPVRPPGPTLTDPTTTPPTQSPDSRWITMEEFMTHSSAAVGKQRASWRWVDGSDRLIGTNNNGDYLASGYANWAQAAFWGFWDGGWWASQNGNVQSAQAWWNASLSGSMSLAGIKLPGLSGPGNTGAVLFNQPNLLVGLDGYAAMAQKYKVVPPLSPVYLVALSTNLPGFPAPSNEYTTRIAQFVSAYCQAFFRGVCERFINNWQVDGHFPIVLLEAAVQAWNAAHEDTVQYTFDPNHAVASFVDAVMQDFVFLPGQTQGYGESVFQTINVGPPKMTIHEVAANKLGMNLSPLTFKPPTNIKMSKIVYGGVPVSLIKAIHGAAAADAAAKAKKELIVTGAGLATLAWLGAVLAKYGVLVFL